MHIFLIFIFKICAFLNEFNNISTISYHSILTFVLKFEFFIFCGIAHNIQSRARQIFLISRSYSENRMLQIKNSDMMIRFKKLNIWLELKKYEVRGSNLSFTINSSFVILDPQLWSRVRQMDRQTDTQTNRRR